MSRISHLIPVLLLLALVGLPLSAQVRVQRPTLGVSLHTEGLAIESVDPGSLGAAAGIQAGDFLTHWGERPVTDVESVLAARDAAVAGTRAQLTVLRGTDRAQLELAIPDPIPAAGLMLGVNIGAGLLVATVNPESPAARAGIKPGDIIESLGEVPVTDVPTLRSALDRVRWGQSRRVALRRGAESLDLEVQFRAPEGMTLATPLAPIAPGPRSFPGRMQWTDSILGLDEVKSEIDGSVADLKKLADPRLEAVIKRLEAQSERLSALAGTVEKMKVFGGNLRQDLEDIQSLPFGTSEMFDLGELQKRMGSLMERHGDDIEALRRALGDEFPGMDILIDRQPGEIELRMETEDEAEEPTAEPEEGHADHAPARLEKRRMVVVGPGAAGTATAPQGTATIEVTPTPTPVVKPSPTTEPARRKDGAKEE